MAKKAKTPVVEVKEKEVDAPEEAEAILFGEEDLENSGLRELLDKGKDQGFLTYQEINSMLKNESRKLREKSHQRKQHIGLQYHHKD